jgi:hypothetical protein
MFFVSLINAATLVYDGDVGPSPESLISSYDAALQALAQNVDTQPLPVDLSAELTKQIEAAGLANYATGLLSQIAEMQKQLDALNLLPTPTQGTVIAVTGTAPVVSTGGISPNISMAAANTSTDGYLTSTDWNTFNNKAPATSGVSILYGNGSGGFSNVSTGSGVSFVAGVLSATGSGGTITSVTATAPIASSGGFTPNISINAAYGDTVNPYAAKTANYVLAGPTSGAAAVPVFRALVAADIPSLSYVTSVSGTSPVVSSGGTTPAISMPAATTSVNGYLTSTDWNTFNNKGSGTVTSVTGTSPVVSSGGATPAISMAAATTSVSGYLTSTDWNTFNGKGSGTVTSVAALTLGTTGTDLSSSVATGTTTPVITLNVPTASASNRGALSAADWTTFNSKGSGTVTSVTGTAPVVSSGGATPAISMAAATTSVNGYLTSTDWTTFNGKQAALVSGTNIKTVNGTTLLGSGDVGTITYAYGGTGQTTVTTGDLLYGSATNTWSKLADVATGNALISGGVGVAPSYGKIGLTTHVSGTLPTANGGTNLTSFTANGVVYASSTSALATGSALTFDGTNFATTGTATATKLIPTGTSVTGNGMYLPNTNSIGISTAGVNAFYIDASQNVGIGTSSPSSYGKFSVYNANTNGTATFLHPGNTSYGTVVTLETYAGTDSPALSFKNYNSGSPVYYSISENSSGALLFNSNGSVSGTGTNRMTLASTGVVTMSAYGAGTATFSAAGVISSVSDETWKIKDGAPVDTDAMLKKLAPGYWYYNEEKQESFGSERQLGFYAQNVNAAIGPEAAPEPEEGKPWGYYDRSVLAVVVMSLQKALDTIESLETRLAALEQK